MRLILAIIILCAVARADTKITWLADVTADRAETVTGAQSNQIHDAAAHIVRADNPHRVTAPQIGALTSEQDLAALRAYHYGSPDIVESPAEWFVFDGAGTITGFDWTAGRESVVIPWAIGGVPVTVIGANAFQTSGIVSVIAPQTVTVIGDLTFADCRSLTSVTIPQATAIGIGAFTYCTSLASISLPQATVIRNYAFADCHFLTSANIPQATAIGVGAFSSCSELTSVHMGQNAPGQAADVFADITPPPTVYVTDPQATGWGSTWNGAPVVRPPLYGDEIYKSGLPVATEAHVAQAIAAIPEWQVYTNIASSVIITNDLERPVRIYGDGSATGTVSFAALREPLPVYVEASGFPGIVWSNAYTVGGGFWQTNAVNVFLIWQSGTNTFVNPVTARPL